MISWPLEIEVEQEDGSAIRHYFGPITFQLGRVIGACVHCHEAATLIQLYGSCRIYRGPLAHWSPTRPPAVPQAYLFPTELEE